MNEYMYIRERRRLRFCVYEFVYIFILYTRQERRFSRQRVGYTLVRIVIEVTGKPGDKKSSFLCTCTLISLPTFPLKLAS